jgi:hypothetical protein
MSTAKKPSEPTKEFFDAGMILVAPLGLISEHLEGVDGVMRYKASRLQNLGLSRLWAQELDRSVELCLLLIKTRQDPLQVHFIERCAEAWKIGGQDLSCNVTWQ